MEFTKEEIDGIMKAMSQKPPAKEEASKIPLRPPGSYGKISKVAFSPLDGEKPRPLSEITEKETARFENLKVTLEAVFGKTKVTLKELAAIEEGSLLPLENFSDEPVDIYANGEKIARGEIVVVEGRFGVKIISFTKN